MSVTEQNENQVVEAQEAEGGAAPAQDPSPEQIIAQLRADQREAHERMLRVAADFENYRRRARKEMEDAGLRGQEGLLKEILPVLDNLDRALEAAGTSADPKANALIDGVRLVQRQFVGALEKFQIKPFDAKGQPFDPALHEAVQQIESDTLPPGTVATVFQRGYMAGSRLLRPAMVAVVRGRPAPQRDTSEGEIPIEPVDGELN